MSDHKPPYVKYMPREEAVRTLEWAVRHVPQLKTNHALVRYESALWALQSKYASDEEFVWSEYIEETIGNYQALGRKGSPEALTFAQWVAAGGVEHGPTAETRPKTSAGSLPPAAKPAALKLAMRRLFEAATSASQSLPQAEYKQVLKYGGNLGKAWLLSVTQALRDGEAPIPFEDWAMELADLLDNDEAPSAKRGRSPSPVRGGANAKTKRNPQRRARRVSPRKKSPARTRR